MSKEVFVTNNLHRISDHIAEAARKGAGMSDEEGFPLPEVQAVRQTARKRARK